MLTILFWNLNRRPLTHLIHALVREHDVDVVVLAETDIREATLLSALGSARKRAYYRAPGAPTRLKILTRFPSQYVRPVVDSGGIAIRQLIPPLGDDFLLVAVHLSSKLYQTDQDQAFISARLSRLIDRTEQAVGHSRTVLVGDLNMNPFESGMMAADGLHAVMDQRIACKGSRVVDGERRSFFYNPMWSLMGDASPGPAGTYYFNTGKQINLFWNTFDQVLVRPDLLSSFDNSKLKVLTEAGSTSLLSSAGHPDGIGGSDHLPILFCLDSRSQGGTA